MEIKSTFLLIFSLLFLSQVFSQSTTGNCSTSCYAPNTSPCPYKDHVCLKSDIDPIRSGCEHICINRTKYIGEIRPNYTEDFQKCGIRCNPNPIYICDTANQECVVSDDGCSQCIDKCDKVNCVAAPCSTDSLGRDCARRVASNIPEGVVECVDNYCGGCIAEWYVNGRRVCEKNVTCSACPTRCPNGTVQVLDPTTGCDACGKCEPICPSLAAVLCQYCPYGYKRDEKGCLNCSCQECPPELFCNIYCPYGNVIDPVTGCKKCECLPKPCLLIACLIACPNGYELDENGCQTCKCRNCTKRDCDVSRCLHGVKRDEHGCPTCECLPPCKNFCPYGYDFYSNATSSTSLTDGTIIQNQCRCKCPDVYCTLHCPHGYKLDRYGCKTCECIEKYENCSDVLCMMYCPNGYVLDAQGCQTCKCNDAPCLNITCPHERACLYGLALNSTNRCPTCDCEPCPQIACFRYCEHGFKFDPKTGCGLCECKEKPVCPNGNERDPANTFSCNLKCPNGYVYENGCPLCKCNEVKPCECPPKPRDDKPDVCPDGRTTVAIEFCRRTDKNVCEWVRRRCPIGISITIPPRSNFTDADLERIRLVLEVSAADFKYEKKVNTDGSITIIVWVHRDGVDPEIDSSSKIHEVVDKTAKESEPGVVSYIYSDGSITSFANVLVPFLGFLFMMLFI